MPKCEKIHILVKITHFNVKYVISWVKLSEDYDFLIQNPENPRKQNNKSGTVEKLIEYAQDILLQGYSIKLKSILRKFSP